jgi:8-oxo-dGTP diphosphatase
MNQRVRAIIIDSNKIALIKRAKEDSIYYAFPGGGVEDGEDLDQALRREMKEELGIEIVVGELFAEHRHDDPGHEIVQYFYLCKENGGVFGTGNGPEYQVGNSYALDGTHEPVWVPLSELKDINLLPVDVKDLVVKKYCN